MPTATTTIEYAEHIAEIAAAQRRLIAAHTERRIVEAAIAQASDRIAAGFCRTP